MQPKYIVVLVLLGVGLIAMAFLLVGKKQESALTKLDATKQVQTPSALGGIVTNFMGVWGNLAQSKIAANQTKQLASS